ncbi:porin family protein [Aliivibrio finisterrensis]|uniref:Porin family protein n=1 Tax=Aliivibrio finisterrensis TaxID=511998 RepID=A0A4Q5L095_9GAMM|nr:MULTISPECIES: outer membrane beta-barrel protein [Aliivibrio]MDD9177316.1 outer membrane beta-barrel protein [Aliivibrio sp. A6]RYU54800.1 porin family protein [Aliivibrio finisterrensis]RYU56474.1 porin family protein [Aliivibrio finisterrensis]RYU61595.1 porin family protein [Aliivibrio finisterrensis]RYU66816.1 porin family protein [Aliivibrio finisterrensis]
MKRLLPLLLLGATASTQATDTLHQIYIQPSLVNLNILDTHGSGLMTQIGYSHNITPMIAMDLSYYTTASMSDIALKQDKASATGLTGAMKITFPMTYYGSFYSKAGLNRANLTYTYNQLVDNYEQTTIRTTQKSTSVKPFIAIGTTMPIFPSMTLNIEYQYMPLAGDDYMSSIGAGINMAF